MATTKALLIPFDDSKPVEVIDLEDGIDPIYDRVAPESRMFDALRSTDFDLLLDDEGLFHPDVDKRVNARAMQLYADSMGRGIKDFAAPLVGDMLAVGKVDDEGDHTDVPQRVIDFQFNWATITRG